VVIVSGHAEAGYAPVIDSLAPRAATLVVLMGLTTRAQIASRLIDRGWPRSTPAAIVSAAGQDGGCAWTGRIDGLSAAPVDDERPGTIVIGEVVALSALIGGVVDTVAVQGREISRHSRG
jgi:siroheme synthase